MVSRNPIYLGAMMETCGISNEFGWNVACSLSDDQVWSKKYLSSSF